MVDPDRWRPLQGQRPGEGQQPGLGGRVGGGAGLRVLARDAADVDDRAAAVLGAHDAVGRLRHVEGREQVERDDLLHEAGRDGGRVGVGGAARVVDEHVEAAEAFHRGVNQGGRRRRIAHVGGDEDRLPAPCRRQRVRGGAPADHHVRPGAEKRPGDGGTDALGAAGDQYHAPREVQRVLDVHAVHALLRLLGSAHRAAMPSSAASRARWWAGGPNSSPVPCARLK